MSSENISALIASLQGNGAVNGLNADISFPGSTISPANDNDLVTKTYVERVAQGLHVLTPVQAATTSNITIATALNNGESSNSDTANSTASRLEPPSSRMLYAEIKVLETFVSIIFCCSGLKPDITPAPPWTTIP